MSAVAQSPAVPLGLTAAQEHVISLLSTGSTISAAAEASGVHRNTISHWRRTVPAFAQALAAAQYDRVLHWRDLTEQHIELAITTIRDLMADPNTPPSVRLRAALALLKNASTLPPEEPALTDAGFQRNLATLLDPAQFESPAPVVQNEPAMHNLHNSAQQPFRRVAPKVGRNDACPCGSKRKYKQCCLQSPPAVLAGSAAA